MAEDTFHLGVKALLANSSGEVLILEVNLQQLVGKISAHWDLPGGRVQRGSTIEQTLRREVAEETGLRNLTNVSHFGTIVSPMRIPFLTGEDVGLVLSVYRCELADDSNDIHLSKEHLAYKWCAPAEAAELLTLRYPPDFCALIATA